MERTNNTWLEVGRRHAPLLALGAGLSLALAGACGGVAAPADVVPAVTGDVSVNVEFGHELTQPSIASFHVWVVAPKEGFSVSCSKLVAGETDPHDKEFEVLADEVFTDLDEAIEFAASVGEGVVYVEGVNFSGEATLAGCSEITVSTEDEAVVDVTLIAAGSYDCGDDETEDGSPCDDGEFCTTGEVCDGGDCVDGNARDCSSQAGDCAAGTCSETEGCMVEPQPDDTPCDDSLACTENDACLDGQCVGAEVQCVGGECAGSYCDELYGGCVNAGNLPYGTPCDDENACTGTSTCNGAGTCQSTGNIVLCPTDPICAPAAPCDSVNGCTINPTAAAAAYGYACDSNPCMDYTYYDSYPYGYGGEPPSAYYAYCDGLGECVGGVPLATGTSCDVGCQTGTCDGSGTCVLTSTLPNNSSCSGTYPGSSSTFYGQCMTGECIY